MIEKDNLKEKISLFVRCWKDAESQRSLYGVDMPQTNQSVAKLFQELGPLLSLVREFSLVLKDGDVEIIFSGSEMLAEGGSKGVDLTSPPTQKVFKEQNINSITLLSGMTEEDLKGLFASFHKASLSGDDQNHSLKDLFRENNVGHIKVDQLRLELVKEGEDVTSNPSPYEDPNVIPEITLGDEDEESLGQFSRESFESSWEEYLEGTVDKYTFKEHNAAMIDIARHDPSQLVSLLKKMMKKQTEVEKFISNLDQKLFDSGFPEEVIERVKKRVSAPRKVLIAEDELARLRKLEASIQSKQGLEDRIDDSFKGVKNLKRKLSDERERNDAILRQSSQGGVVLDKDGVILSVNLVAQKALNISSQDAIGKKLRDIMQSHHMVSLVKDWHKETDEYTPKEVEVHSSDHATIDTIQESSSVVEDQNGKPIGVISSLQHVEKQQELEKRKNDLLDVLGHDLRAPICAIKQNFSMLLDYSEEASGLDEQQKKFFDLCKRNIDRVEKLVEKIFDIRQLETGKIILKNDDVDMNKTIEEAAGSLDKWAKDKNIEVKVNIEPDLDVYGDPERIYQVVMNFVSNALKFTPSKGTVEVQGRPVQVAGENFVEVSVRDSGIGIKHEDLSRIFNKYEQVSLDHPVGASGLGLGLSICKSVVELHGGKIWAESEEGKGSTFIFQIPVESNKE